MTSAVCSGKIRVPKKIVFVGSFFCFVERILDHKKDTMKMYEIQTRSSDFGQGGDEPILTSASRNHASSEATLTLREYCSLGLDSKKTGEILFVGKGGVRPTPKLVFFLSDLTLNHSALAHPTLGEARVSRSLRKVDFSAHSFQRRERAPGFFLQSPQMNSFQG